MSITYRTHQLVRIIAGFPANGLEQALERFGGEVFGACHGKFHRRRLRVGRRPAGGTGARRSAGRQSGVYARICCCHGGVRCYHRRGHRAVRANRNAARRKRHISPNGVGLYFLVLRFRRPGRTVHLPGELLPQRRRPQALCCCGAGLYRCQYFRRLAAGLSAAKRHRRGGVRHRCVAGTGCDRPADPFHAEKSVLRIRKFTVSLPLLFGAQFVWHAVAVAEAVCLCIAVVLWRVSERRGIVYR